MLTARFASTRSHFRSSVQTFFAQTLAITMEVSRPAPAKLLELACVAKSDP